MAAQDRTAEGIGDGIDPVLLGIINNNFVNICREMGITMTRTAFSPIFNEGLDFSCVLFDRHGNMIGQAEFCPAQLGREPVHRPLDGGGARRRLLRARRRRAAQRPLPRRRAHPRALGDPAGVPRGRAVGVRRRTSAISRRSAARRSGSFAADATEVFQEGLRIPPVKIVSRDENNLDLWRLIMANHRTPRNTWGDLERADRVLARGRAAPARAARPLRRGVRLEGRRGAHGLLRAVDAGRRSRRSPTAATSSPTGWRTTASSTSPCSST